MFIRRKGEAEVLNLSNVICIRKGDKDYVSDNPCVWFSIEEWGSGDCFWEYDDDKARDIAFNKIIANIMAGAKFLDID